MNQELQAVLEMLKAFKMPEGATLDQARQNMEAAMSISPRAPGVVIEPVKAGRVPGLWCVPEPATPGKALLYFHGGGYIVGSARSHTAFGTQLAEATGFRVLLLDYRLAPEHPFPAAVDDALAAYRWLLDEGYDPAGIALGGDSAGGGLAIAALLAIRDAKLPLPAAASVISPMTDLTFTAPSYVTKAGVDPFVTRESLAQGTALYLAGASPTNPLASPLHGDLSGLPPLLIQVGSSETLLDDSTGLAARAGAAGVRVRLEIWPEMIHVWHLFWPMLGDARRAIAEMGGFLKSALSV